MMRNVDIFITGLDSGGAERQLLNLIQGVNKSKYLIRVYVLKGEGFYSNQFKCLNIEIIYLNLNIYNFLFHLQKYTSKLKFRKEKTVIMSWLYHADFFVSLIKLRCSQVDVIWNIRCGEISKEYGVTTYIIIKLLSWLSHTIPKEIIYNSYRGREVHELFGYRKIGKVVVNSLACSNFKDNPYELTKNEKIVFGVVGRPAPQKGYSVLFRALNMLPKTIRTNLKIKAAGFDDNEVDLSELSDDIEIKICGRVDNISTFYNSIDMLILPSVFGEGMPNVIIEAFFHGKPSIGSEVGDVPILLGEGRGVLVPPGDIFKLSKSIEMIADMSRKELQRLYSPAKLKKYASVEFDVEAVVQRYEKFFNL
jgi:glycosyltransferase involved in cell wall biosynthesis